MTKLSLFSIIFLFTISSFAGAYWVSLDGSSERSPEVNVVYSNAAETVLEFRIYGFNVKEVTQNGTIFHKISFPNVDGTTNEIGKPELPTISGIVGIPDNAEVNFEILDIETKDTTGFFVFPLQTPISIPDSSYTFYIDTAFYNQSNLYPAILGELSDPAVMRAVHFISCIVCPLEFNPALQKISANTYIKLRLNYQGGISSQKHVTPAFYEVLKNLLLNCNDLNILPDLPDRGSAGVEYLFIVHANHEDKIEDLVNWYKMLGYQTRVKSYGYVPTYSEIKNEISDEYFSHPSPCLNNVLLVGSKYEIPPYEQGTNYPMSDSWYSFLEGGSEDFVPDIGIGRLSAGIEHFADRIIGFEKEPNWITSGWLDNIQLIAHWENTHLPDSTTANAYFLRGCEAVIKDYEHWEAEDFNLLWGEQLYNANNVVKGRINNGKQILVYYGHGLKDCWNCWARWGSSHVSWTASNIHDINHSNRPPILFSNSCLNNQLGGCINEYWTGREAWERNGVSAALGGAHNLYYPTMTAYLKEWFNQLGNNNLSLSLGYAHMEAVAKLISGYF